MADEPPESESESESESAEPTEPTEPAEPTSEAAASSDDAAAESEPASTDDRAAELEETEQRLDEREASLVAREQALDERENDLRERHDELAARAEELDRREDTLREYVGQELADLEQSLSATVEDSVRAAVADQDGGGSRLGQLGNVVLALVGLLLVSAAVANLVAAQTPGMVRLFGSATLNVVASGVLIVLGVAATLVGVTRQV